MVYVQQPLYFWGYSESFLSGAIHVKTIKYLRSRVYMYMEEQTRKPGETHQTWWGDR